VEIEASSSDAAFGVVSKMYKNEDIILSENDFTHVTIIEDTFDD